MKADSSRSFLLLGCTSYLSRGDEAIVRGTMAVLRNEFGSDVARRWRKRTAARDRGAGALRSKTAQSATSRLSRPGGRGPYWAARLNKLLHTHLVPRPTMLGPPSQDTADAALMLAADNYSLDYGIPRRYIELGEYVQRRGVPLVLWGASVGPFDTEPEFAREMFDHLRSMSAIFARDQMTADYLAEHGVTENVHRVMDPAFVMEPIEPEPGEARLPDARRRCRSQSERALCAALGGRRCRGMGRKVRGSRVGGR